MVRGGAAGMIDRPTRGDLLTYVAAMVLLIVVGVVGASLHIKHDLTAAAWWCSNGSYGARQFWRRCCSPPWA